MPKVQTYLSDRFQKSHWQYHGVNQLMYDLREQAAKDELREEIRQLRKDGVIDITTGLNGYLIKIIDENKFL